MKTTPIVAAEVDFSDPQEPRALAYDDVYHPRGNAAARAKQVFLGGSGLPARWQQRQRFCILETGFGLGHNFLATWAAWREDPARCERLTYVSIEKHPLTRADLERAQAGSASSQQARALIDAWPAHTANLHTLDFDAGRVRLLLAFGDVHAWARELVARVDAFFLDGFAPARNPAMWDRSVFGLLARVAAPDATVATWTTVHTVRDGLRTAGFDVSAVAGGGGNGEREITLARFAPRFSARPPPGRSLPDRAPADAIVVGAGLAGACTARALALQGITCTVLDRHAEPAAEASGNPAGLFHGAVMGHDGPHARLHRAAALAAARDVRAALARGVPGRVDGLLRLQSRLTLPAMQALLDRAGLPAEYVLAMSADTASAIAGLRLAQPAWFFPGGGWVDPGALVRDALATPGVDWRGQKSIARIERVGERWRVFDAADHCVADAAMLVLANAEDALRLAGLPSWLQRQRGQVSWAVARSDAPRVPVASGGYAVALPDGRLVYGATSQADDDDASVRAADHADNLARAVQLLGELPVRDGSAVQGRVGWRATSSDRLPLVGRVPDLCAAWPARCDAPRLVPHRPGLWLHAGLGSRGLTTAPLCAELIAAWASGDVWPLEADLVDAIDPARCLLRGR